MDCAFNAIELASPAFHADLRPGQYGQPPIHLENFMRADFHAYTAAVA
jgi:hypothetical protein